MENLSSFEKMPFPAVPVVNAGVGIGNSLSDFIPIVLEDLFGAAQALVLREDPQDWRVNDKALQARRAVHGEIYLFHEDDPMVFVPVMQNGVERGRIHILTHQKEFSLGDHGCRAVVRQSERVAEVLERFWLVPKDKQKVCAVFDVIANLAEPAFNVGVYKSQFSMSEKKHEVMYPGPTGPESGGMAQGEPPGRTSA